MEDTTQRDRIVVGVDGSAPSVAALRYAARIADAFDAPIEAITTWTYPPFSDPSLIANWSPERDAAAVLDEAVEEAFAEQPPVGLVKTVLIGPAAGALIEVSRGCALLVLGSRGRGGFAGLHLGSVGLACAAHASCPVVIVHGTGDADAAAPAPATGAASRS